MHFASNSIHTLIILKFQTFCTKQKTASSSVQWTRNEYNLAYSGGATAGPNMAMARPAKQEFSVEWSSFWPLGANFQAHILI